LSRCSAGRERVAILKGGGCRVGNEKERALKKAAKKYVEGFDKVNGEPESKVLNWEGEDERLSGRGETAVWGEGGREEELLITTGKTHAP